MAYIARLTFVLAMICIVAAGALALTEGATTPVIEQRIREELFEAMADYVPEADNFEEKVVNDKTFYIAEKDGEEIGYIMTASAAGYGGPVYMNVAVDTEGGILAADVDRHTETPGIGDVIEDEEWLAQFDDKTIDDEIALDVDIDNISGSTVSCRAATNAVRNALDEIGAEFLGVEMAEWELDAVEDGTYEGTGSGFGGDILVEVTVSGGEITAIEIIEHSETPDYFELAKDDVPERIIDEQDWDVDEVGGATMSSIGIKEAVFDALAQ